VGYAADHSLARLSDVDMTRRSERWKALEREAAETLHGRRVLRRWDLFETAPDVLVEDFRLVIDAKAYKKFAHHTLMATITRKYCGPGETPVLVTKAERMRGAYATVPLEFLARLLDELRAYRKKEISKHEVRNFGHAVEANRRSELAAGSP
jgi:hypothetical protein